MPRLFKFLLLLSISCNTINSSTAQKIVIKNIRSFGAKGDGKKNDTEAFQKAAAFFNSRKGMGKLVIPKGVYIIGRQVFANGKENKEAYEGADILHFENCNHLTIEGQKGAALKYCAGLRLGSFDPFAGKKYEPENPASPQKGYAARIGHCIYLKQCYDIVVDGLTLDGNNGQIEFGGRYGDKGIQLQHYGFFVLNSRKVMVQNSAANYFGLDGICIGNSPIDQKPDSISILHSVFEYNCRQGLSWVGGNDLLVKNCRFNHSGRGKYSSAPASGVDIESENAAISGGRFYDCEFVHNNGCGLVADSGPSDDCRFFNCIFWGTATYSVWVTKPGYTFTGCKIYGSMVHGFNAKTDKEATRFIRCDFEDKPYKTEKAYGGFLIESEGATRISFDNCNMTANTAKIAWLNINMKLPSEEKATIRNCHIVIRGAAYPKGDFIAILRGVNFQDNTVEFTDPAASEKNYWPTACCPGIEDLGGNKIFFH